MSRGVTVQDYYDRVAGFGNVILSGMVKGWVTVDHPEAYYGADTCSDRTTAGLSTAPATAFGPRC